MLAWDGRAEDALQLKLIRNEICCHIVNASRDKMWHSACVASGEVDEASPMTSIARARGINVVDSAAKIAPQLLGPSLGMHSGKKASQPLPPQMKTPRPSWITLSRGARR